jgi:ubiquinone/menaquinone biosynthesis C-methylase UbiE
MEVVDLCSGDGWFTLQIARLAHHVIAIDIDSKMLEAARIRLIENQVTNCTFVPGDAYDLEKTGQASDGLRLLGERVPWRR